MSNLQDDTASSVIIFWMLTVRPSRKNLWQCSLCVSSFLLQSSILYSSKTSSSPPGRTGMTHLQNKKYGSKEYELKTFFLLSYTLDLKLIRLIWLVSQQGSCPVILGLCRRRGWRPPEVGRGPPPCWVGQASQEDHSAHQLSSRGFFASLC